MDFSGDMGFCPPLYYWWTEQGNYPFDYVKNYHYVNLFV